MAWISAQLQSTAFNNYQKGRRKTCTTSLRFGIKISLISNSFLANAGNLAQMPIGGRWRQLDCNQLQIKQWDRTG
jgi:hypothetical protein